MDKDTSVPIRSTIPSTTDERAGVAPLRVRTSTKSIADSSAHESAPEGGSLPDPQQGAKTSAADGRGLPDVGDTLPSITHTGFGAGAAANRTLTIGSKSALDKDLSASLDNAVTNDMTNEPFAMVPLLSHLKYSLS